MVTLFVKDDGEFIHADDGGQMVKNADRLQCATCGQICSFGSYHLTQVARVCRLRKEETKGWLRLVPYTEEALIVYMERTRTRRSPYSFFDRWLSNDQML